MDLNVDLGFRIFTKQRVRLHGINTPETYGTKKGSAEWEAGMAAKNFVLGWLDKLQATPDDPWGDVMIRSFDGRPLGQGKYGRWLVEVYFGSSCLNHLLVNFGHAERVEY